MLIESIEIYCVQMPLIEPWRTAYGDDYTVDSVLVKLTNGNHFGWGESAPWQKPTYSPESAETAFMIVKNHLAPILLNYDVTSGQDLQRRLALFKGNQFAKAALDNAWWDLHARMQGKPLWQSIGGASDTADAGADFGVTETVDELLASVQDAITAGHKRVKLKCRPGWDLNIAEAVRKTFPDLIFHMDCNSGYTLDDIGLFKQLDEYGLAMIEQPLMHDDLVDHAKLQQQITTPICLDESIASPDRARKAIEIGACKWINIKPGRLGGMTNALAVYDICQQTNTPCWIGGMLESAVGGFQCHALSTLANIAYPSDIFPTERFYTQDLANLPITFSAPARITAPDAPGCGVEPDPERLEKMTLHHAKLSI